MVKCVRRWRALPLRSSTRLWRALPLAVPWFKLHLTQERFFGLDSKLFSKVQIDSTRRLANSRVARHAPPPVPTTGSHNFTFSVGEILANPPCGVAIFVVNSEPPTVAMYCRRVRAVGRSSTTALTHFHLLLCLLRQKVFLLLLRQRRVAAGLGELLWARGEEYFFKRNRPHPVRLARRK
jgi:hypothetical protein